jgi:hypothetical protein
MKPGMTVGWMAARKRASVRRRREIVRGVRAKPFVVWRNLGEGDGDGPPRERKVLVRASEETLWKARKQSARIWRVT